MAARQAHDYGVVTINGRNYRVHRLALERELGRPIHPGLDVLHSCDRPACCNPEHLREGTDKDNRRDSWERNPKFAEQLKVVAERKRAGELRRLKRIAEGKSSS